MWFHNFGRQVLLNDNTLTLDPTIGHIHPRDIEEEMQTAYLDYAMSVIVARAAQRTASIRADA